MFSIEHILFMVFSTIAIIFICQMLKDTKHSTLTEYLKISAIIVLLFDPMYWLWEYLSFGVLDIQTTLPLYICSLFWMLMPVVAFCKDGLLRRIALSNICTICLFSGIMGTIFNTHLNIYPFFSFVPLRSLIYHFFMISIPCVMWKSKYYVPTIKDTFLAFIPLASLLVPCTIINNLYNSDYCYTKGGAGTPLEMVSNIIPSSFWVIFLYSFFFVVISAIFFSPVIKKAYDKWDKRK